MTSTVDTSIETGLTNVEVLARATRSGDGREVTVAIDQAALSDTLSVVRGVDTQAGDTPRGSGFELVKDGDDLTFMLNGEEL